MPPMPSKGRVGVKCATITPDEARVKGFGLKESGSRERHHPNIPRRRGVPRARHCKNVPRLVPAGQAGSSLAVTPSATSIAPPTSNFRARHADDEIRRRGRSDRTRGLQVPSAGIAMGCTISTFHRDSPGLAQHGPVQGLFVISRPKEHDPQGLYGRFKSLPRHLRTRSSSRSLTPAHHLRDRLIDDMVAAAMKCPRYVWPAKNYERRCASPTRWRRATVSPA